MFHVRVRLALEQRVEQGFLSEDAVLERLRRIGSVEYAEIRSDLQREEMLLPPGTDESTYIEFAGVFLEYWYFARDQLSWYFPALRDVEAVLARRDPAHVARDPDAVRALLGTQRPRDLAAAQRNEHHFRDGRRRRRVHRSGRRGGRRRR